MVDRVITSFVTAIFELSSQDFDGSLALASRATHLHEELRQAIEGVPTSDVTAALARAVPPACRRIASASHHLTTALRTRGPAASVAAAQLLAACMLADECCELSHAQPSPPGPESLEALYSCVELLLWPGLFLLQGYHPDCLLSSGLEVSRIMLQCQVLMMNALLKLVAADLGDVATFTRQLAPPERLLPWLAAAAHAAPALHGTALGRGHSASVLDHMSFSLFIIVNHPAFGAHAQRLAQDPAVQRSLVQLLVPALRVAAVSAQLPPDRRPPASSFSWHQVQFCVGVLVSPCVILGLHDQLRPAADGVGLSASAWQLLHSTAQLVAHAPHDCPGGMQPRSHAVLWYLLGLLLGMICGLADDAALARQPQQAQQAAVVLQQAVLRLPRALQLAATEAARLAAEGDPTAGSAADRAGRLCKTWYSVVATLLPLLQRAPLLAEQGVQRATVAALASGPNFGTAAATAAAAAEAAASSARLAAVPAWCAAGSAMLRALPQVAAAFAVVQQAGPGQVCASWQAAPAELADSLLTAASGVSNTCRRLGSGAYSADEGAALAAARAAWPLHTACCRAVHWCEQEAAGECRLPGFVSAPRVRRVLACMLVESYNTVVASSVLLETEEASGSQAGRQLAAQGTANIDGTGSPLATQLRAMSVGHLEALTCLLDPGVGDSEPGQLAASLAAGDCLEAARGLVLASRVCSPSCGGLSLPLQRSLRVLCLRLNAARPEAKARPPCIQLLGAAASAPLLTAWLAAEGLLRAALDSLASFAAAQLPDSGTPLHSGLSTTLEALTALCLGAEELLACQGDAAVRQQRAAVAAATARVRAASTVQGTCMQYAALADYLRCEALPAALELAAALLAQQPTAEEVAAGRLAAAQAATGRSCAYLRCTNLRVVEDGGPAAGQGVGAKRCSGCRGAWYCNTACSHADWRAEHKRVCAALAAARQQQQQQEQQH